MVRDFDDNEFPLAYFISFRTYGTWLHGDERWSVDRNQNKYGTPRIAPNKRLQNAEHKLLKHPPVKLNAYQRPVVEKAIRGVCKNRGYKLLAINVRTNHVHTVVSAQIKPEPILQAFQAYATRNLRKAGCWLRMLSPGLDMAVHRICGRRNTWSEQLIMCSMGRALSCQALMTDERGQ